MNRPRIFSGREILRGFTRLGFSEHHRKGRHVTMKRDQPPARVTLLDTPKDIGPKLFHKILREAGISVEEFLRAM